MVYRIFRTAVSILAFGALLFYPSTAIAISPTGNTLGLGQALNRGDVISSPTGNYKLIFQLDGNLVQYNAANQPVWYTGALDPSASKLILQNDGNLVLYNSANQPIWYTTAIYNANTLAIQDDGNMVVYDNSNHSLWNISSASRLRTSQTISKGQVMVSGVGGYYLILQNDGNLVLYNSSRQPVWTPGVYDATASRLILQSDGNVVLYNSSNQPVWSTKTSWPNYNPNSNLIIQGEFVVQGDSNLVLYNSNGMPVWHR
jgi:hypothetical protein